MKPLGPKHILSFKIKQGLWGQSHRSRGQMAKPQRMISRTWTLNRVCPAGFLILLGTGDYIFPSILFLRIRNIYSYLLLSYVCLTMVFGREITFFFFSSFTGPQMERNFAPWWIIPRASTIPNLDDWDDEIWAFWTGKSQLRFWIWLDAVIGQDFREHCGEMNTVVCEMDVNLWGPEFKLCSRLDNGSPEILYPNIPGIGEYVTFQVKRDFAGRVKWGAWDGEISWISQGTPMQELGCGVRMEGGVDDRSRGWSDLLWIWSQTKECSWPWGAGRVKETYSPLKPPERTQLCRYLDFSP